MMTTRSLPLLCVALLAAAPTQNLAISEAITANALTTTPQSPSPASWPLREAFYSRVLGTGQTQLTAMLALQPDLVSVEFGVNEVLGARSGLVAPGLTIVPIAAWQPVYDQLVAGVKAEGAKVLLVGLLSNVTNFPSLRRGAELDANRSELAQYGILVSADCAGSGSENLVYVPAKVVGAYAAVMAGQPSVTLSCADVPGTQDYVLTTSDVGALEAQLVAMNTHVRGSIQRDDAADIGRAIRPVHLARWRSSECSRPPCPRS